MKSKHKEDRNKRYYLHSVIRAQGYNLDSHLKTIFVACDSDLSILSTQVMKLIGKYGYNLQTIIT